MNTATRADQTTLRFCGKDKLGNQHYLIVGSNIALTNPSQVPLSLGYITSDAARLEFALADIRDSDLDAHEKARQVLRLLQSSASGNTWTLMTRLAPARSARPIGAPGLLTAAEDLVRSLREMAIHPSHYAALEAAIRQASGAQATERPGEPVTVVIRSNCAPVINQVQANVCGVRVIFVDEDTEACDADSVVTIDGVDRWVAQHTAEHDASAVAAVAAALVASGVAQ